MVSDGGRYLLHQPGETADFGFRSGRAGFEGRDEILAGARRSDGRGRTLRREQASDFSHGHGLLHVPQVNDLPDRFCLRDMLFRMPLSSSFIECHHLGESCSGSAAAMRPERGKRIAKRPAPYRASGAIKSAALPRAMAIVLREASPRRTLSLNASYTRH